MSSSSQEREQQSNAEVRDMEATWWTQNAPIKIPEHHKSFHRGKLNILNKCIKELVVYRDDVIIG